MGTAIQTRRGARFDSGAKSPVVIPASIRCGRVICGDLNQAERREWWLTNGLGAYAAGTVAETLTRRYHGLLIAPIDPPLGRRLVFAKADATLIARGRAWPLHTNRWRGGIVEPSGYSNIEAFHLDGAIPVWRYAVAGWRLEKRVWLERGSNTVYVAFRLASAAGASDIGLGLSIKLLVNGRDHHGDSDPEGFTPTIEAESDTLRVAVSDATTLTIRAIGGRVEPRRDWYWNFDLPIEAERGLGRQDHHLCAGEARLDLRPNEWVGLAASVDGDASTDLDAALGRRRAYESAVVQGASVAFRDLREVPAWVARLALAADAFLFARPIADLPGGESVIAGYPWFGDWGRDTMIALPGLTLATGRHESARKILETFGKFLDQGMLPNVFPGRGERPEYNTADATLWFIEAWRAYVETTGDLGALDRVFAILAEVIDWHLKGTRYGIGADPADGLLHAGEPGMQLTWMDAKVGDWVVTPRIGKPVEINALWFNALVAMAGFAELLGRNSNMYAAHAHSVRRGFSRFVKPEGTLYDVIDGPNGHDATIRPNQILAVSMPHSALEARQQAAVVAECRGELLTSYGLRSLSPRDPAYRPQYRGGVPERDGGYHQGAVWAWLLGPYTVAEHRVTGDAAAAQARLEPIADHLADAGLGQVSEIFDGDPPHHPRGCPAQAWSVACILEAWWRLENAKQSSVGVATLPRAAR
jgi:predicted glycogen debranching enzyme